jgi:hypothetical protein
MPDKKAGDPAQLVSPEPAGVPQRWLLWVGKPLGLLMLLEIQFLETEL